ncbi:uncharacterized protein GIQ15_06432 [Arthroderma uncinatum]|uniref:uncharacterized protein n=1 Tax=Arthroderma uncinatum TaxID=74035 RepID=UPI00144AC8E8|nr:uncharacterized protein GIQ15_06432 [Arthroderma uncinatum]KAF3479456.1 hypothetical protein GIQ15_06432 [Arthroderma uncinatum]
MASMADAHQPFAPQKLSRYRSVRKAANTLSQQSQEAPPLPTTTNSTQNASISRSMSRYRKTGASRANHAVPPPPLPMPTQGDYQHNDHIDRQRSSYDERQYNGYPESFEPEPTAVHAEPPSSSRRASTQNARPIITPLTDERYHSSARHSVDYGRRAEASPRSSTNRHSYINTGQYDRQFFDGRDERDHLCYDNGNQGGVPHTSARQYFVDEPGVPAAGMGPNTFDERLANEEAMGKHTTKKSRGGRLFKDKGGGGGFLGRLKGSSDPDGRPQKKDSKRILKDKISPPVPVEMNEPSRRSGPGVDAPVSAVNAGERKVTVKCNESFITLPITPTTQAQDLIYSAANCLSENIVPESAIIVESFQQLNLERPLRKYEHVRDVMNSWNTDAQNCLKIITDPDPNIIDALLAKSAPRKQPPDISFNLYHCQRTGKWDRRWITLRTDGQVTVSKKQGSTDSTNICHISDFDIYTPTRKEYKRLKPPKPLCFAVKSQQKSAMFLSTENFVHYFCTKHEDVGGSWHNAVQEWRSWYLVNVLGEGTKKKKTDNSQFSPGNGMTLGADLTEPHPHRLSGTPYQLGTFQELSIDPNMAAFDNETYQEAPVYDVPTGRKTRPTSFNAQAHGQPTSSSPPRRTTTTKESTGSKQKQRTRSKSISKKKGNDEGVNTEQPFAPSGLLGRAYTQRQKAMLDREKEQAVDNGPFISTGLLSNIRPGAPSSPLSQHFPDHPGFQPTHQQQQQQNYYPNSRENTMTGDPRPVLSSQPRSKSTRHPPKPLIDLTPTYKEPPQHARKGRGVTPMQGVPLVESATGPDLHPNAIVVPPSTTWRKPSHRSGTATSDPYARDNQYNNTSSSSRHRSNTGHGAPKSYQQQQQGPLVDLNGGGYPGHVPGAFPFLPGGLVAQSQKAGNSQGASTRGRGIATGRRDKISRPLLDISHITENIEAPVLGSESSGSVRG